VTPRGSGAQLRQRLPGDRVSERSEPLDEIVELVARVQAARVRQDPEPRAAEIFVLRPEHRVASTEPRPVRADPEHDDEPRMQWREPILERPCSEADLVGAELCGCRGGSSDEVRQAEVAFEQRRVLERG